VWSLNRLKGHVPVGISRFRLQPLGRLPATNQRKLAIALSLRNTNELMAPDKPW
jgi:hypothetical protein